MASFMHSDYGHFAHHVKRGKRPFAATNGLRENCVMPKIQQSPGSLPDRLAVGRRLVALREALGLDKATMADRINCDRSSYIKYETGERNLTLAVAWRIYRLYGFTLDFVYDGKAHGIPAVYRDVVLSSLSGKAA